MQDTEVRKALVAHLTASRRLLGLRKGAVPGEMAEEALIDMKGQYVRLVTTFVESTDDLNEEYWKLARHLLTLSKQLMLLKSREFAIASPFAAQEGDGPDDLEGGAAVYAVVTPPPRPRFGKDAKPLPEDED